MEKKVLTNIALALSFCVVTATLVHMIPTHYTWKQFFTVEGSYADASAIEKDILALSTTQSAIKAMLSKKDFNCKGTTATALECDGQVKHAKQGEQLDQFFRTHVPKRLGWVSREELADVILNKKDRVAEIEQELKEVASSIDIAKKRLQPKNTAEFDSGAKLQTDLIREIADKKQQLTLIEDAMPHEKDVKVLERFEQKAEELESAIADLELKLSQNHSHLDTSLSSDPEARELLLRKAKLIEESKSLEQVISDNQYALNNEAEQTFKNPDGYRLKPEKKIVLDPQHSYGHLLWSFSLGFIPFGLIRRFKKSPSSAPIDDGLFKPEDFFSSAEEVETLTGLKNLGTLT